MKLDPTIKRIRDTRHKISERFDHDSKKYIAYLKEEEKKYKDRLVNDTFAKKELSI